MFDTVTFVQYQVAPVMLLIVDSQTGECTMAAFGRRQCAMVAIFEEVGDRKEPGIELGSKQEKVPRQQQDF